MDPVIECLSDTVIVEYTLKWSLADDDLPAHQDGSDIEITFTILDGEEITSPDTQPLLHTGFSADKITSK